jgi:flagellar biosynthesis GTPase FlhF
MLNRVVMAAMFSAVSLVGMSIPANAQSQPQQDQKKHEQQQKTQPQARQQQQPQAQNKQQQQRAQQQQVAQGRLPQQRQQQLIAQQQQQLTQYRQHLDQGQRVEQQHVAALQQQGRMAQYRYQQQYSEHVRQQQMSLQNDRHDYNSDPYFYTAPNYRYNRGGRYYETNQYGADLLRQAVNYGYQEGFGAGQADRQDHWRSNYQASFAYQDANYGYGGYYVDQADYNYYFRQGFRRGYGDGYYSRYQYGSYSNGKYTILAGIMGGILDLQSLR